MFSFFERRKPESNAVGSTAEWQRLQKAYADPAIELAKTKQAAVVSAASVIDRIWNGHGGGGWDESCETDYVAPLREHLVSREVFGAEECATISQKLDDLVVIGRENLRKEAAAGEDEDVEWRSAGAEADYLVARVVEWCRHFPDPVPLGSDEEYHGHF